MSTIRRTSARSRAPAARELLQLGWPGYDGLVDVGYAKQLRPRHNDNEIANLRSHINDIEPFWSYAKRRLNQFNGVPRHTFYLHLKETKFRFNHRRDNLYQELLKLLRTNPIYTNRK